MKFEKLQKNVDYVANIIDNINIFQGDSTFLICGSNDNNSNKIISYELEKSQTNIKVNNGSLKHINDLRTNGEITSIINNSLHIYSSTTKGLLYIFEIDPLQGLVQRHIQSVSSNSISCTGLTLDECNNTLALMMVNGNIKLMDATTLSDISEITHVNNSYTNVIAYISANQMVTCSTSGVLKLIDYRQSTEKPSFKSYYSSGISNGILCFDKHPFNQYILVTGHLDGSISFWDLRKESSPLQSSCGSHKSFVSGVKFHPVFPNRCVFSCSEDASLYAWYHKGFSIEASSNPWFSSKVNGVGGFQGQDEDIEIFGLLSESNHSAINCMDVSSDLVVCGTDNEALHTIYLNNAIDI